MSKTTASVSQVQQMMSKMDINENMFTYTQSISPNRIRNQALHCSQQQQRQRDGSLLFYQVRQKRKQRRLKQGPRLIHHQRKNLREINRDNQKQAREMLAHHVNNPPKKGNKFITGIVGSSIARNISVKNIESEDNEVRLHFRSGSDCADALAWLQSNEGQSFMRNVDQLVFILGTNDIHRVGADETARRIDSTVGMLRRWYLRVNIV